ncbi:MAG: precorrin-6y C5,15-methyltransferase (decarboxylating) subunit CbiE [Methanobacterium sp. BRmetb2]|jgi:cobalt-precorrin-7 (C5)-methyltransferase|nr:MAG: precorrin-6y C5,15-methyltransferase (decarboxylating) subunit CbiE [Methanobacterium sp. BRmetb2]
MEMSKFYIVGIGPGSKEYLTLSAVNTVESSDIVIGSKRALNLFEDIKTHKVYLNANNIKEMIEYGIKKVNDGLNVSILSTGDPGFSGLLKTVLKTTNNIEIEVIPGISSIQLCAARLQIPWDDANLITIHGKGVSKELISLINNGNPTIILPNLNMDEIVTFLLNNGVNPKKNVAVCERLSYDDERIIKTPLKNLLNEDFSYMCVMVIY